MELTDIATSSSELIYEKEKTNQNNLEIGIFAFLIQERLQDEPSKSINEIGTENISYIPSESSITSNQLGISNENLIHDGVSDLESYITQKQDEFSYENVGSESKQVNFHSKDNKSYNPEVLSISSFGRLFESNMNHDIGDIPIEDNKGQSNNYSQSDIVPTAQNNDEYYFIYKDNYYYENNIIVEQNLLTIESNLKNVNSTLDEYQSNVENIYSTFDQYQVDFHDLYSLENVRIDVDLRYPESEQSGGILNLRLKKSLGSSYQDTSYNKYDDYVIDKDFLSYDDTGYSKYYTSLVKLDKSKYVFDQKIYDDMQLFEQQEKEFVIEQIEDAAFKDVYIPIDEKTNPLETKFQANNVISRTVNFDALVQEFMDRVKFCIRNGMMNMSVHLNLFELGDLSLKLKLKSNDVAGVEIDSASDEIASIVDVDLIKSELSNIGFTNIDVRVSVDSKLAKQSNLLNYVV